MNITWLTENENKGKWEENRILLRNLYYSDTYNEEYYLRAVNECWYVLIDWNFIENVGLNYNDFRADIGNYLNIGYSLFNSDARFIWMVGNMMTLFPELFANEREYESEIKNKGVELLNKGRIMYPDNAFIKVIYDGAVCGCNSSSDSEAARKITDNLNLYFPGNSRIEQYYSEFFINAVRCVH